jgi:shikimate dehydrogenase
LTRLYGIVGRPVCPGALSRCIELRRGYGLNAVLVPMRVTVENFDQIMPAVLAISNLDGLLVTAPFKARCRSQPGWSAAASLYRRRQRTLRREADANWSADMFDGRFRTRSVDEG